MVITGIGLTRVGNYRSTCLTLFIFHLHADFLKLQMLFGAAWRLEHRDSRWLSEIKNIVDVIRDSVEYVRQSDARLKIFSEIVKQLNLPNKKLVDDCRTRWNSTYEMLGAVIKFKNVFPRFADREPHYDICPSAADWTKAEKPCLVLELFWAATHIVSGSDYPTSHLFLNEVSRVKVLSDKKTLENDIFIQYARMNAKWGETNLLMSIAVVIDPRSIFNTEGESIGEGQRNNLSNPDLTNVKTQCGWSEYAEFPKSVESIQPQKSKLDLYLEDLRRIRRMGKTLMFWIGGELMH
ncbi:UNVERIFIED_CONTAM: Zinc finger BED domain-containing protein RICESLEEPER 1 [Sesamum radiatum]|uniref:Zinc finger BED domain-containing protein RICESLEEPER 1 n=1 Tax=Sesamum radiatum TaxID=300843 RepID=A0AAW2TUR3_SESRA